MKTIKFKRYYKDNFEIAFNEKHLHEKLNGDMAYVIMPSKSLLKRLWVRLFPKKFVNCELNKTYTLSGVVK